MIPLGAIINALGITIGSLVGLAFGARLPERVRAIVFQGLGLCVLVIGFKMALLTQNPLIVIFSIVIGSVAGEMIGLEARLIRVGDWLKGRLKSSNPLFTEGMVNASVLFCIGAMAIIGSFDEGLRGDRAVVLSKTIIDSFAALAMASAYGLGVLFSAIPVLIYQGALTLLAGSLQSWLDPRNHDGTHCRRRHAYHRHRPQHARNHPHFSVEHAPVAACRRGPVRTDGLPLPEQSDRQGAWKSAGKTSPHMRKRR